MADFIPNVAFRISECVTSAAPENSPGGVDCFFSTRKTTVVLKTNKQASQLVVLLVSVKMQVRVA